MDKRKLTPTEELQEIVSKPVHIPTFEEWQREQEEEAAAGGLAATIMLCIIGAIVTVMHFVIF